MLVAQEHNSGWMLRGSSMSGRDLFGSGRFALLVDGASVHQALRIINADIDYRKLLAIFADDMLLVRAMYYAVTIRDEETGMRRLLDWLDYNGYRVREKRSRGIVEESGRGKRAKVSLEIAVDALEMAGRIDHLVLFSGDGDLVPAVRAVQRKGVCVTAVSTLASKPHMIASELRRQVDRFMDLRSLMPFIQLERG